MLLRKGVLGGDVAQLSGQTLALTKGFSKGVLDKVLTSRTMSLGTHRVIEGASIGTRGPSPPREPALDQSSYNTLEQM